ncbi:MAG: hypothetical protein M3Q42_02170 [Pseudomonadota bacterium]|nr:hypothetical protein [Pseudomonadota bacterium]
MLRELSEVLGELHDGLVSIEALGNVSLTSIDMTLPLQLLPVFRDGGCVLLADLPRSREANEWVTSPSKLRMAWQLGNQDGSRAA